MPQKKVINRAAAMNTFDELQDTQFLMDAVKMILDQSGYNEELDSICYLLSVYREKMNDVLPRLSAIIGCKD